MGRHLMPDAIEAKDENYFEAAIDVFSNGADMVVEKEDRSDREGIYPS